MIGSILIVIHFLKHIREIYARVIVYQVGSWVHHSVQCLFLLSFGYLHLVFLWMPERSFRRWIAYVIAVVAEFDEHINDRLYLREGNFLPE